MKSYPYSEDEKKLNQVLIYQNKQLKKIQFPDNSTIDTLISESEELLESLGMSSLLEIAQKPPVIQQPAQRLSVPDWDELCHEAAQAANGEFRLESLFTAEELAENKQYVQILNQEYNVLHRLDAMDYCICALAGVIAGAVDILLVGIPQKTTGGLQAGPLSNYIRDQFNKAFPSEEMEKLANAKASKVPYDAQDNRNTFKRVEGLSAYYHRLLSLGHDPLLGFVVGVMDILNGTMTTVDKTGHWVTQVMKCYEGRREANIFAAIAKQIMHLKSDITTSMGLPAPLMGLFNLLQFGSIGDAEQTIAEIVQGMYYEGYDFIHFCSMSIPTMVAEVIVRLLYFAKRLSEGYAVKESIPFSLSREKHPKLATMLFVGHAAATAINAGKVYFTENPLAINYPQWMAFAKYSYSQLKWTLIQKPMHREKYVSGKINEELDCVYTEIDKIYFQMS